MLGNVSRQRASVIANQRNFPEPVAVLAMGKVWRRSDVVAWIREHRPELAEGLTKLPRIALRLVRRRGGLSYICSRVCL